MRCERINGVVVTKKGIPHKYRSGRKKVDPLTRFNQKLDKVSSPTGCWLWLGTKDKDGYGKYTADTKTRKMLRSHRYAYEAFKGPIPDGLFVLHECDNPTCCNPDHLKVGTHRDNVEDRNKRGRQARGETGGNVKLSEFDVQAIRRLYTVYGKTSGHIAELFDVYNTTVLDIVERRTWKHIP